MLVEANTKKFKNLMTFGETLLNEGKTMQVKVGGISMFPYLRKGDIVFIKKESKYALGDIVVFKTEEKFIAHRLIKFDKSKHSTYIISRGDSMLKNDLPIPESEIMGKVIQMKRNNKLIDFQNAHNIRKAKLIAVISPYMLPINWFFRKFYSVLTKIKKLVYPSI